jgi:hypothetical protein
VPELRIQFQDRTFEFQRAEFKGYGRERIFLMCSAVSYIKASDRKMKEMRLQSRAAANKRNGRPLMFIGRAG